MSYNWGRERRRGTDRREPRIAPYVGPERRRAERRVEKPRRSVLGWAVIAVVGFVMLDNLAWHSFYLRGLVVAFNADAAKTRAWSDNVWHFS